MKNIPIHSGRLLLNIQAEKHLQNSSLVVKQSDEFTMKPRFKSILKRWNGNSITITRKVDC